MRYQSQPRVAYFCMEYGLHASFTTYSGGLGILAGDVMKSAGDLRVPLTGIGILWDRGYTKQTIGEDGAIRDEYPSTDRSALEAMDARVHVEIRGESVELCASRVRFHTDAPLYLLEPVHEEHRWMTRSLYGGGAEDRIAQEMILGIGGVRMLRALGIDVDVYHFNEGHAVFAGHELIREERATGKNFEEAAQSVRSRVVFTTHTPVPAGNEVHDFELVRKMGAALELSDEELTALGGNPYGMTVAGLRGSRLSSAVAELHGETARGMWKDVTGASQIVTVTNGVHPHTWQDARIRAALGKQSPEREQELESSRAQMKAELCAEIHARTGVELDQSQPLIGFARRAATYKRANLILGDARRLRALFDSGVQLVYSGKAHPADEAGKEMVASLVAAAKEFPRNIVFLENYDMVLGSLLTRGCDVWLNNPRRPQEACGTSGMKAAMNGVLNCSILDGWWPEGCEHGVNGWRIAADYGSQEDVEARDELDRDELYRVIEEEVVPAFAKRETWNQMVLASIEMSSWRFSSDRMVQDYYSKLYSLD